MLFITLAAGSGTRLGQTGKITPKTLIEVGQHWRICDTHKNLAQALKATHWYLVVGSHANQIKQAVMQTENGMNTRVIVNPLHRSPSPLYSLARVIPLLLLDDVIIANGDTLYSQDFTVHLAEGSTGIRLFVSDVPGTKSDMKIVLTNSGTVHRAVTPLETCPVVSSGLVVVRGLGERLLFVFAIIGAILRYWMGQRGYWHQVFNGILSQWGRVQVVRIAKSAWYEVDTEVDIQEAQKHVASFF